ncbi:hypothetical protein B0H39_003463 [Clostridium beijerinckii]|uniref:hypothetical protein n=1 Tax=Clostridium beijerinckii TaxID=1520 RepID=UPI001494BE52|nr:hypothetical protein [Clostridium beijerinckii]NOW85582.1 hypothetical protein [Clostridium beijerinckii]
MEKQIIEALLEIKKSLPEGYVIVNYAALKEESKKVSEPCAKLISAAIDQFKI